MNPTWVYFIQAGETGPVKIGATASLRNRIKSLTGAHYEVLRPLGVLPFGEFREDRLLRHFQDHRIRGEWFHPVPELLELAALARKAYGQLYSFGVIDDEASEALQPWREICADPPPYVPSPEAAAAFDRWKASLS